MSATYRMFRAAGLRAEAAYTAAYCAARVAVFGEAEVPAWAVLFRRMTAAQLADVRGSLACCVVRR